jgi:hypothetical protein
MRREMRAPKIVHYDITAQPVGAEWMPPGGVRYLSIFVLDRGTGPANCRNVAGLTQEEEYRHLLVSITRTEPCRRWFYSDFLRLVMIRSRFYGAVTRSGARGQTPGFREEAGDTSTLTKKRLITPRVVPRKRSAPPGTGPGLAFFLQRQRHGGFLGHISP